VSLDETLYESTLGRVVQKHDGGALVLVWHDHVGGNDMEMVRFHPDAQLLRIFPKTRTRSGLEEQFERIRELQLDFTMAGSWDDEGLTAESVRVPELELTGLPDGFGTIIAYGLGLRRQYRGMIHQAEDRTDCTVVRFGTSTGESADGNVFHVGLERFASYKRAVDRNRERGTTVVRRVNQAEAHNAMADLLGLDPAQLTLGRHPIIQAMTRIVTADTSLDAAERAALVAQMSTESKAAAAESPQAFGKLREDIELVSLQVLIDQFEKGLRGAVAKDEGEWQQFFEANVFALQ
jgi:hypothetical protein